MSSDLEPLLPPAMKRQAEERHAAVCLHEAGHALAAVAAGAAPDHASVLTRRQWFAAELQLTNLGSVVVANDLPPVHDRIALLLAGPIAEYPGKPLEELLGRNFIDGQDLTRAREDAFVYFAKLHGHRVDAFDAAIDARAMHYLDEAHTRVQSWLRAETQQRALIAISEALKSAAYADGLVPGQIIIDICQRVGVEHRPAMLLPLALPGLP